VISAIASGTDRAQLQRQFDKVNAAGRRATSGRTMAYRHTPRLEEALQIRNLLMQTGDELTNLLRGLNGAVYSPAPGGDLLDGVLPTGRNIHA